MYKDIFFIHVYNAYSQTDKNSILSVGYASKTNAAEMAADIIIENVGFNDRGVNEQGQETFKVRPNVFKPEQWLTRDELITLFKQGRDIFYTEFLGKPKSIDIVSYKLDTREEA